MDIDMNAIMQNLNTEQKQAVLATKGYVRILAGPGTGKTKVLTSRHCHLVQFYGVEQKNILSVTFTNKAAMEMRKRVTAILGISWQTNICTFHGFCLGILKHNIHRLNYPNQFMIIDRDDQVKLLREIYADMNISAHEYPPAEMIEYIAILKGRLDYVPHVTRASTANFASGLRVDIGLDSMKEIFVNYLKKQREYKVLDFDDMLYFALYLLRQHQDLLDYWQNELQYIQVDEFQDVNKAQYELVVLLQGKHRNLFVVGDPDQTIYSWRGSDISFINEFDRNFPGTQTFLLTTNYRSSSSIIDACNSLIKHNKNRIDKPLVPVTISEGMVIHYPAKNIYDEACFIARAILDTVQQCNAQFNDIGILYRASYMSRVIEESLIEFHIPYTVVKGTAFYERQEIKDALAFLRLLVYGDNISFERIINKPARKMGRVRLHFLKQYARDHQVTLLQALLDCAGRPPLDYPEITQFLSVFNEVKSKLELISTSQALDEILDKTGYEQQLRHDLNSDRIDNVMELKRSVTRQEETAGRKIEIAEYLAEVALYAELTDNRHPNSVQLMTIHACKGLEFPYVIVCGMNEGGLPSGKGDSEAEMEEERRLAYVAFSRARNGLMLTNANGLDFNRRPLNPSRFLSEVKLGLIRRVKKLN